MLTLPIKKKWFDMILAGVKKEEYRDIKPYYTSRFINILNPDWRKCLCGESDFIQMNRCGFYLDREFPVIFRNGYASDSPRFKAMCSLSIAYGVPEWGGDEETEYYTLIINSIELEGEIKC